MVKMTRAKTKLIPRTGLQIQKKFKSSIQNKGKLKIEQHILQFKLHTNSEEKVKKQEHKVSQHKDEQLLCMHV